MSVLEEGRWGKGGYSGGRLDGLSVCMTLLCGELRRGLAAAAVWPDLVVVGSSVCDF